MGYANMNFLRQGFQKLSPDRQTDRHTDIQTDKSGLIKHATSLVLKNRFSLYQQFLSESKNAYILLHIASLHCIFTSHPSTDFGNRLICESVKVRYSPLGSENLTNNQP